MKVNLKSAYVGLVAVVAMTACGGSSDDGAGQLSEFQVSPEAMEVQSGLASCPGPIKTGDYAIIGGTAPYTVYSPYHQLVTFSAAGGDTPTHAGTYTVSNRNGQFAIYVTGCFEPATVTILDDLKRVAVIEVSYVASGAN